MNMRRPNSTTRHFLPRASGFPYPLVRHKLMDQESGPVKGGREYTGRQMPRTSRNRKQVEFLYTAVPHPCETCCVRSCPHELIDSFCASMNQRGLTRMARTLASRGFQK